MGIAKQQQEHPVREVFMSKRSNATAMAGEFFVMERLYRLGHDPALTLGQAKSIDILVKSANDRLVTVSVKAVRGGGKWGIGKANLAKENDLVFVFLLYRKFADVSTDPDVYVIPACDVEKRKRGWLEGNYAIYHSHRLNRPEDLEKYKDAWEHIG